MEEEARIIIGVNHSLTRQVINDRAVKNNLNSIKVKFIFDSTDWQGITKTAVFVKGRVNQFTTPAELEGKVDTVIVTDDPDGNCSCVIPSAILASDQYTKEGFSIGIYGQKTDFRIVSDWQYYRLDNGCYLSGAIPDPPVPVYDQIIAMINEIKDLANDAIRYTPQTLTEAQQKQARENIGIDLQETRYTHKQTVASAEWDVIHNLDCYPSVTVVDSAGDACYGEIHYVSDKRLIIKFSAPFQGTAYIIG